MIAVDVVLEAEPQLSAPHMLFERHYAAGPITIADYDVAPDGSRSYWSSPKRRRLI